MSRRPAIAIARRDDGHQLKIPKSPISPAGFSKHVKEVSLTQPQRKNTHYAPVRKRRDLCRGEGSDDNFPRLYSRLAAQLRNSPLSPFFPRITESRYTRRNERLGVGVVVGLLTLRVLPMPRVHTYTRTHTHTSANSDANTQIPEGYHTETAISKYCSAVACPYPRKSQNTFVRSRTIAAPTCGVKAKLKPDSIVLCGSSYLNYPPRCWLSLSTCKPQ